MTLGTTLLLGSQGLSTTIPEPSRASVGKGVVGRSGCGTDCPEQREILKGLNSIRTYNSKTIILRTEARQHCLSWIVRLLYARSCLSQGGRGMWLHLGSLGAGACSRFALWAPLFCSHKPRIPEVEPSKHAP